MTTRIHREWEGSQEVQIAHSPVDHKTAYASRRCISEDQLACDRSLGLAATVTYDDITWVSNVERLLQNQVVPCLNLNC